MEFIVERITLIKFGIGSNGQLTNRGKARYSEADECDSNRLWTDRCNFVREGIRCSSKIKPIYHAE